MYSKKVIERFQDPQNGGGMHGANAIGEVNGKAGDIIRMYLKVDENTLEIENSHFKTFGCCGAIVASDVACDLVKGKKLDDALGVSSEDILDTMGGLPSEKRDCAILAEQSIKAAVKDFYDRKEKEAKKAEKAAKKSK